MRDEMDKKKNRRDTIRGRKGGQAKSEDIKKHREEQGGELDYGTGELEDYKSGS